MSEITTLKADDIRVGNEVYLKKKWRTVYEEAVWTEEGHWITTAEQITPERIRIVDHLVWYDQQVLTWIKEKG